VFYGSRFSLSFKSSQVCPVQAKGNITCGQSRRTVDEELSEAYKDVSNFRMLSMPVRLLGSQENAQNSTSTGVVVAITNTATPSRPSVHHGSPAPFFPCSSV